VLLAEEAVTYAIDRRNDRPLVLSLVAALVVGAAVGTQYVAWRLGFHPNLGPPLYVPVAGVPVYAPYRILVWQYAYAQEPALAPVLRAGWLLTAVTMIAGAFVVTRAWRRVREAPAPTSHGSARWGDGEALHADRGLLLGRQGTRLLRLPGEGHVLTVAPTRSGKGTGCVIPSLLDYPGSVLVTDPKGENYAVTARWRQRMGEVHALDPFGAIGGTATFNPLDLVDITSPDAVDDARMLADMIVLPEERGRDEAFWNEEARGVLTGLILHVAASAPPESRTLTHVRTLLTAPPDLWREILNDMLESEAAGGLVARAAARILQKADRERSGVISTAQSHTHFLDSTRMVRALGHSSVDLVALKRERMSVYLVLPPDRLHSYARWLRLMIACSLLAMTRMPGQPAHRVLFLLDEFAHLGRMTPVQRDIGLVGGYGARIWLFVQDLSQLRATYGDAWTTFLANADALQAFGTADWDTADYLSRMSGDTTIRVASENESRGVSRGKARQYQRGTGLTMSETGRRLLLPDEVRRLPADRQLLFVKGQLPLLAERLSYLRDLEFAGRADANPLYAEISAERLDD
jgi:type IV secretion system protein VirD4